MCPEVMTLWAQLGLNFTPQLKREPQEICLFERVVCKTTHRDRGDPYPRKPRGPT
jgi:hypothetical protein